MAESDENRGLIIVYTGGGKGKTTAALGLCLRAVGHGNKIALIQFIKSEWEYGELAGLKQLTPEIEVKTLGAGCIGILDDNKPIEDHRRAAQAAFAEARRAVVSDKYDMVILDEISIAMHLNLIPVDDVIALMADKPERLNLVLTGRYANDKIIELADLVTEMVEIKHPFALGCGAKRGIDY